MSVPKALKNTYIRSATEKLRTLDELWETARTSEFTPGSLKPLKDFCHRLAGSGGSYGFPALGDAARALELAILNEQDATALESACKTFRGKLVELSETPTD
jgi:HPt (histidine-containing phosphotransfer) domain-containing protein